MKMTYWTKLNDERVSYFIRLDKATGISSHFFSSHNILSDRDLEKCLVTLNSVAKTTKIETLRASMLLIVAIWMNCL